MVFPLKSVLLKSALSATKTLALTATAAWSATISSVWTPALASALWVFAVSFHLPAKTSLAVWCIVFRCTRTSAASCLWAISCWSGLIKSWHNNLLIF